MHTFRASIFSPFLRPNNSGAFDLPAFCQQPKALLSQAARRIPTLLHPVSGGSKGQRIVEQLGPTAEFPLFKALRAVEGNDALSPFYPQRKAGPFFFSSCFSHHSNTMRSNVGFPVPRPYRRASNRPQKLSMGSVPRKAAGPCISFSTRASMVVSLAS